MDILGISAWEGPSSACLVRDGRVLAAAREDRFSRIPDDAGFPRQAIEYCLRAGKIGPAALGRVALSGPERYRNPDEGGARSFLRRMTGGKRESASDLVMRELDPGVTVEGVERTAAHAAGAFLPSPFEQAAVLVLAPGTATIGRASGTSVEILESVPQRSLSEVGALVARAHEATGLPRLAVGGPEAGRPEAAAALAKAGAFDEIWIQPAAAGGADAVGAALQAAANAGDPKAGGRPLGPGYNSHQVRTFLRSRDAVPEELPRDGVAERVAALLGEGLTVGWFGGRMDLGDCTAATRSVLSRPESGGAADGSVLTAPREVAGELFDLSPRVVSPLASTADGRPVLRVDREEHRSFHDILSRVGSGGADPVLGARPLARAGDPPACTPRDAFEAFEALEIDALVLERYLVLRRP